MAWFPPKEPRPTASAVTWKWPAAQQLNSHRQHMQHLPAAARSLKTIKWIHEMATPLMDFDGKLMVFDGFRWLLKVLQNGFARLFKTLKGCGKLHEV